MGEQSGVALLDAFQPFPCLAQAAFEPVEGSRDPADQTLIQVSEDRIERRSAIAAVVRDPAAHHGIYLLRQRVQMLCLCFTSAVADRIVGIAFERTIRIGPAHPDVERVVQEQVGQQGRDHPTLRRPPVSAGKAPVRYLDGCGQPSLDIQQHPAAVRVGTHRPHQQRVVDAVEEGLDIEIKYPIVPPATPAGRADRIERRASRAVAVGVGIKPRSRSGSSRALTTACATRSPTVGIPSGRLPPLAFGISTRRTGGG